MDRIHRLGQNRPVTVTRLIIENSIESRILELQEKKTAMTSSTLGDDAAAMGRLTAQDLEFLVRLFRFHLCSCISSDTFFVDASSICDEHSSCT